MIDRSLHALLQHVSLRQLETFETVARLQSFSRAADALHCTQPTVSMQIKKLSEAFGAPLVEHVGKRFFLTPAGEEVFACCQKVLEALGTASMNLAHMSGLTKGRLRLSVVTTAEYFAPRVLGGFCRQYPGIDIELKVLNRQQLLRRLAENLDDLYILGQPPGGLDLECTRFLKNPQTPLAAATHPLARERDISLERFAAEPMIMREAGSGTRKAVEQIFAAAGLSLQVVMELGSNEAIKQAVAGGLGVSVLSRHTLGDTPLLAVLDVRGFPIERHWHVAYPKGKTLSPVAQAFYDFLLCENQDSNDIFFKNA